MSASDLLTGLLVPAAIVLPLALAGLLLGRKDRRRRKAPSRHGARPPR